MDSTTAVAQTPSNDISPTSTARPKRPKGRDDLQLVSIDQLRAHPRNPRIALNEAVIAGIAAQLQSSGQFHASHAIVIRPFEAAFQVVEGHHRVEAARRAALKEIPAWVRLLDDDEALLALGLANAQGELSGLEVGIHSLAVVTAAQGKKGIGIAGYAARMGLERPTLVRYRHAAEVFEAVALHLVQHGRGCREKALHLSEIHRAPAELWIDLVRDCVQRSWTVRETTEHVRALMKPKDPLVVDRAALAAPVPPATAPESSPIETASKPNALPFVRSASEATSPRVPISRDVGDDAQAPIVVEAIEATTTNTETGVEPPSAQDGFNLVETAPDARTETMVFANVGFGHEVLAMEDADGGFTLAIELPATRVVLRLRPASEGGVLVRVERALANPDVIVVGAVEKAGSEEVGALMPESPEVVEATVPCGSVAAIEPLGADVGVHEVSETLGTDGGAALDSAVVAIVPEVVALDVGCAGGGGDDLVEETRTDDRVSALRLRLRELVKEGRGTISKSAARLALAPKAMMSGALSPQQIEELAAEVARVTKRGRARG